MKNFFERLFSDKKNKKFLFTTKNLRRPTANGDLIDENGNFNQPISLNGVGANQQSARTEYSRIDSSYYRNAYVVDELTSNVGGTASSAAAIPLPTDNPTGLSVKEDERKLVNPKEVFDELKKQIPEVSFDNLDEKIRVVEERLDILSEHLDANHLKDERMSLFYLNNRRKYLKTRKKNPIDWLTTTRDAVDDLCKNYKLKVVPIKQFYTLIPKEGVKEIERYTRAYKAITGDNPIFELIVKDTEYGTPEHKEQKKKDRDPILIANSPFGKALFILGAWDDEVEIVDEIIYYSK